MEKPYIKKYNQIGKFTIWIVDGKYIRENLDREFTNCSHHYRFNFIPKNEFWIDKKYGDEEEIQYFINGMIALVEAIEQGKNYNEAVEQANKKEKKERSKNELILKELKKLQHNSKIINKIHIKLLEKYSKTVKVWIVNGRLVRDLFFLDFTEGGHDKVYSFIPENEVWIDNDVSQKERKLILLHELYERNLMVKGISYDPSDKRQELKNNKLNSYKSAHKLASKVEYYCRHNPKLIDSYLKKEIR